MYTLGQAAKATGLSKTTISKALKNGTLSCVEKTKAGYKIDPSELARVYPLVTVNGDDNPQSGRSVTPEVNPKITPVNSALEIEVKLLREQIDRMDAERERERSQLTDQIEALRTVNEEQRSDFRQTVAALTDQRDTAQAQVKQGFWARLVG